MMETKFQNLQQLDGWISNYKESWTNEAKINLKSKNTLLTDRTLSLPL